MKRVRERERERESVCEGWTLKNEFWKFQPFSPNFRLLVLAISRSDYWILMLALLVIWCFLFAWKEVCGAVWFSIRQKAMLCLITYQSSVHVICSWFEFFFLLKLRSGLVIRVFKPLTRYPNRIVGFPKRRNRIRPAKGFRPTRWASGRSDSGGLIGS